MRPLKPRKSAYELLSEGRFRWVKGYLFGRRTKTNSHVVKVQQPKQANCFCLLGALKFVYPDAQERRNAVKRLARVISNRGSGSWDTNATIWGFNDDIATYKDVLEVPKQARV